MKRQARVKQQLAKRMDHADTHADTQTRSITCRSLTTGYLARLASVWHHRYLGVRHVPRQQLLYESAEQNKETRTHQNPQKRTPGGGLVCMFN